MNEGMMSFSGVILDVKSENLLTPLSEISALDDAEIESIFADYVDVPDDDLRQSLDDHFDGYLEGRAVSLMLTYGYLSNDYRLTCRLIIDRENTSNMIEVVCYRDPILTSPNPIEAMFIHFEHLKTLCRKFKGRALFFGPDGSDYPKSETEYPEFFLKVYQR